MLVQYGICSDQRHILRERATQHCCLPSFLGDGEKGIEIVFVKETNILYQADNSSQARTKISCAGTTSPSNQPRKDPSHLYSLSPYSPQFQQSVATPLQFLWQRLSLNGGFSKWLDLFKKQFVKPFCRVPQRRIFSCFPPFSRQDS